MTKPVQRFARVALRAERDSTATMNALLADLDRELRTLRNRRILDKTAQAQIARIVRKQSQAWADLSAIIDRDREAARKAANLAANDVDREFWDKLSLSPKQRREMGSGVPFNRRESSAVAQRVSGSNKVAQKLLTSRLNKSTGPKEAALAVRAQIQPRQKGGISYVAKRLVRTEMAAAFQDAQIARAEATPWVIGLRWMVSPSHKGADICDKLKNRVFAPRRKSVPEVPHPNCMCTLEPVVMSNKQFKAALTEGVFDAIIGKKVPVGTKRKQL
jgi:hypothetical protein